jgi:hypothetical protein
VRENAKFKMRNPKQGQGVKRVVSLKFIRSGVHPEGFSSGDITGTTLKGVKRVHPEGFSLKGR